MSIFKVNNTLINTYPYVKTQKIGMNKANFMEQLKETDSSRIDTYKKYLEKKYGNIKIQSVEKDQGNIDRVGKSMSGSDVIIAPNILKQMANDPEKAAYYEGKIDDFFHATPKLKAAFAAKGLDYQPCGVVIHDDGNVTYIGGCSDSPERIAEVNAINKAKQQKKVAQRKQQMEAVYKQKNMKEFSADSKFDMSKITFVNLLEKNVFQLKL